MVEGRHLDGNNAASGRIARTSAFEHLRHLTKNTIELLNIADLVTRALDRHRVDYN